MSNHAKVLRGQMRQIVKELFPELMTEELRTEVYKTLAERFDARVKNIEENVKTQLEVLDQRSKDTNDYLVRQLTQSAPGVAITQQSVADAEAAPVGTLVGETAPTDDSIDSKS